MRAIGPLLLGLLLGAVVGVGAMKLVGGGEPGEAITLRSRAPAREPSTALAKEPAKETDSPAALPAPVEAERIARVVDSAAPPATVVDAAIELARNAPPGGRLRGDKKVCGRIALADGTALADVLVRATCQADRERNPGRSTTGLGAPSGETLEGTIRSAVEGYYDRTANRAETMTAADGSYELTELRGGRWYVSAWRDGFALETVNGATNEVRPDATLDFLATAVEPVIVRVQLPNGDPAPSAALEIRAAGSDRLKCTELWTTESAIVRLTPGELELRATLGDPQNGPSWPELLASSWAPVTIESGVAARDLVLPLRGTPGVRGRIEWPPGVTATHAMVKIAPAPANGEPDLKALANDHQGSNNSWVRDEEFIFRDLAPGRYVVAVSRNWSDRIVASAIVEVGGGMVEQNLAIPPLDPASCLVVKATGPDGKLLEEVTFDVGVRKERNGTSTTGVAAERKQNGNYWVPLPILNDVDLTQPWPEGIVVTVIAHTKKFGDKSVEVAPGTRALQIKFGDSATLIVTVAGFGGSGYEARLQLALERADTEAGSNRTFNNRNGLGADGTQKLGPVETGAYRLVLRLRDRENQWEQHDLATQDVNLVPGENRATIALPAIYSLTVELVGGAANESIALKQQGEDYARRRAEVDATGRATFEALTGGDYVLEHYGAGDMGIMRVHVPAAGVVRFEAMAINALEVTVDKKDGKLYEFGLRSRDLVIAVDGKEFTSAVELQMAVMQVMAKKEVVFTVLRGNDRLELTFDPRQLMDQGKLGGRLEPTSR